MSDKDKINLPFDSGDKKEQQLWSALENLPRAEPSPQMRRSFYHALDHASTMSPMERLRDWLGMKNNVGWITAAAAILLGVGIGQTLDDPASTEPTRLAALEQNVAKLNRELILDRLEHDTAGKRLRGIIDAAYVVQEDIEVARALLLRATEDKVASVRTAAIDALGSRLATATVGDELMKLLGNAESPLVQFALVDLVLRNGSDAQLRQLLQLAKTGGLHPDLTEHVNNSLGSESV